jgi:hypothetical protein
MQTIQDNINAQIFRRLGKPGQKLRDLVQSGEDESLVLVAFSNVGQRGSMWEHWPDMEVYTPAVLCSNVHSIDPNHWYVEAIGTCH